MRFLRSLLTIPHVAIVTAFGSLLGLLMRLRDPSGDWVLDLARWWSGWVTGFAGVHISVDNRSNLESHQPYVFMANHASTIDIWALFLAIPRRVRMIAKKQLARIPLFGWVMWAGRFIFIDRQNAAAARRSIDDAGRRIRGGDSVLIFPEGTRTRDGQLGAFKKGGFQLAPWDWDFYAEQVRKAKFNLDSDAVSQYFELDRGVLTGDSILCTLHLSRFSLLDGEVIDPPAELPLAVYPVAIEGERLLIEIPAGPLEVNR